MDIWQLLIQFIFRLTFGVALAMRLTPSRWVTSGFYRVHLWVLLGLNTFAAMAIGSQSEILAAAGLPTRWLFALAVGIALASYAGSVIWLYEGAVWGGRGLWLLVAAGVAAAALATPWNAAATTAAVVLNALDFLSSGTLLGLTLAAMFLGHWYLNTPTMQLQPLRRLVLAIAAAILVRAFVSGLGLALHAGTAESLEPIFWAFVALRWLAGLAGPLVLAWMTWLTLKIPNTQSATGILYAAVILTFIGELTSQLLMAETVYPV